MELKNAVAVCLISLFSATLVVLIARSLDNQAASRLEPQLAQIAEELRAIRTQGGIAAVGTEQTGAREENLVVYYFHGNIRCATCEAIESQTHEVVERDFAGQLESGEVVWETRNYEEPVSADLVEEFDIHMANVVLCRMRGDEQLNWRRLDKVWALVGDKPAFAEFVRGEIREMIGEEVASAAPAELPDLLDLPLPELTPPPTEGPARHVANPPLEPDPDRPRRSVRSVLRDAQPVLRAGRAAQ